MATRKQELWKLRSRLLWRLKGFGPFLNSPETMTDRERFLLGIAKDAINSILEESVLSSRSLGFNAKYRCKLCGKPVPDGLDACLIHDF